ncbi:MAG: hypothetical protein N4J56_007903 [Chroococcidiopsis sp. SAG 2025]|uniref:hypothetical protein n=1 Tax=Chroococcidiopsis sp. SAG 2025 TaxID=171389 RepID=UPI0029374240|nr:hypothetical protein [Chroococcidiopsis sp. SAG 2025]MDV2998198.1 hypothetical protein [Chroococcidiopsis sp. SAG 2025]
MSKFNISQAAKVTGKARSTIQAHLKNGKFSAEYDAVGNCLIDAAELHRVYGVLRVDKTAGVVKKVSEIGQAATPHDTDAMQQRIQFLEEKVGFFERQLQHEREEKNRLLSLVENQTRQLTDQRKKRWWFR